MIDKQVNVAANNFGFAESNWEIRQLGDISGYQDISARPLFDADREPEKKIEKKKVTKKKVVEKKLMVQALGIAITGENLLAVVKDMRNGKILRLRVNEQIDGWTLTSVSADSFVFSKGATEKVVKFKSSGG